MRCKNFGAITGHKRRKLDAVSNFVGQILTQNLRLSDK